MKGVVMCAAVSMCMLLSAATNDVAAASANLPRGKAARQARQQCEATTLSGNRCKRRAAEGARYCRQHEAIMRRRAEQKSKNPEPADRTK